MSDISTNQIFETKLIHWLVYEIGFINDAVILGDISNIKFGMKKAQKSIDEVKTKLKSIGITDSFFMMSEFGGMIRLSYEYKRPDGYVVKCSRITPTGQLRK